MSELNPKRPCKYCDGTGRHSDGWMCLTCDGTGMITLTKRLEIICDHLWDFGRQSQYEGDNRTSERYWKWYLKLMSVMTDIELKIKEEAAA